MKQDRRSSRRRARNAHNDRGVHHAGRIRIDTEECKQMLRDEKLDGLQRLILLVSIAAGDCTMSFAQLAATVRGETLAAGTVQAAIERRLIVLR